jgi:hypothetical protein
MANGTETALVNGSPVMFWNLLHEPGDPATVLVAAPVRLSAEDLVAVLFGWFDPREPNGDAASHADLRDDAELRRIVINTVFGRGFDAIDSARAEMDTLRPRDPRRGWLVFCRERIAAAFPEAFPNAVKVGRGGGRRPVAAAPRRLARAGRPRTRTVA